MSSEKPDFRAADSDSSSEMDTTVQKRVIKEVMVRDDSMTRNKSHLGQPIGNTN